MNYTRIFFSTGTSLDDAASVVSGLIGVALSWDETQGLFVALDGDRRIALTTNHFTHRTDLADLAFDLHIDGRDDEARVRYARRAFRALTRLGQRLIMVDQMEPIDRFDPSPATP